MLLEMDYCLDLNTCPETHKEICYSNGYQECGFYRWRHLAEDVANIEKGLTERLKQKIGNSIDENWMQL